MSVYSGFATRQQQNKYNFLLQTLVIALKKRIIKFYKKQQCDQDKFRLLIKKIYKKLFLLQKGKYMPPKYTSCFTDLVQFLQIQINLDSMSDVSSMMSQTFSLRKQSIKEDEDNILKSKNILQSKRNLLMEAQNNKNSLSSVNMSAFSLKKANFNTLNVLNAENQQEDKNFENFNRSTSLGVDQSFNPLLKPKIKLRRIQDLKNLRGTLNMPKFQDFLPKKQQIEPIQPNFFKRPSIMDSNIRQHKGGGTYRRQKYSRAQINVQQI